MKICKILEFDLLEVKKWKYINNYSKFNYATKQWFKNCCNDKNIHCYKAVQNNNLLGVFLFQLDNEFRILINPKYLHKGFGRTITQEALSIGFDILHLDKISLIVRQEHNVAINLYLSLGFKIIGKTKQIVENEEISFFKMIIDRRNQK